MMPLIMSQRLPWLDGGSWSWKVVAGFGRAIFFIGRESLRLGNRRLTAIPLILRIIQDGMAEAAKLWG